MAHPLRHSGCASRSCTAGSEWRISPIALNRMTSTRSCFSCFGKPLFSHKQGEHLTHNRGLIFKRDLQPRYMQRSRFKSRPLCMSHVSRVFFCRHELYIVMA